MVPKTNRNANDENLGFRIGHWTDMRARTGCTVILFDELTPCVVDVRGGAPGTRETDLLGSGRSVRSVDAVLLTGGSAFGLAAADGVVRYLAELGRGYPTCSCPIPIVSAAVVFDKPASIDAAPGSDAGYAACHDLQPPGDTEMGRIGVGVGCTLSKLWGPEHVIPGGIGINTAECSLGSVTAIVAVNAAGAPIDGDTFANQDRSLAIRLDDKRRQSHGSQRESTTIGVVVVNALADYPALERCAVVAHDGLARSIRPAHTAFDGDTFFVAGPSRGTPEPDDSLSLAMAAEAAVERAIQIAVGSR